MNINELFRFDALSLVMISLISFVTLCVAFFAARYLHGDRKHMAFNTQLASLFVSLIILVSADHMMLLLFAWILSNSLLVSMMLHKANWRAAKASATLAYRHFVLGWVLLGSAVGILYALTGETSIHALKETAIAPFWQLTCGVFIVLAAMIQSSIWPAHRWLISSLNSPTPVSAIMHAGLVNGGGFLLVRFVPLISDQPAILSVVLMTGFITALLGSCWKLLQSDIKRMLACSTVGQMGFMFVQIGMGLFPAAVAHLCWHGLFKAYLFLASGSAAEEQRQRFESAPNLQQFAASMLYGLAGVVLFSLSSGLSFSAADTTWVLLALAWIAGVQFSLTLCRGRGLKQMPLILLATCLMGTTYGFSMRLIEQLLSGMSLPGPQPLNGLHVLVLLGLLGAWLGGLFIRKPTAQSTPEWQLKAYVTTLNASQPHPKTITTHRNHYQF